MSQKRRSKCLIQPDPLIQMDICNAMKNLKNLHNKQNIKAKQRVDSSVIVISDDLNEEMSLKTPKVKTKIPFPFSDDEDDEIDNSTSCNASNMNSTLLNSDGRIICSSSVPDETKTPQTRIKIISNEQISPPKITSMHNTNNAKEVIPTPKKSQDQHPTALHRTSAIEKTPTKATSSNTCVSPVKDTATTSKEIIPTTSSEKNKPTASTKITVTPTSPKKDIPASPKKHTLTSPKKEGKPLKNFLKCNNELISSVFQSKSLSTLLNEEEKRVLKNVQRANPEYQFVCFKLYKWLPKWYNLSKFVNSIKLDMKDKEIVSLFEFLRDNDIVDTDYTKEDIKYLLELQDNDDIKNICKTFKIKMQQQSNTNSKRQICRKDTMIDLIMEKCSKQMTLTLSKSIKDLVIDEIRKYFGKHVIKIKEKFRKSFHHVFILATFTNPLLYDKHEFFRQMMTNNIEYPKYELQDHVVFYSRLEFISYVTARNFRDDIETNKDKTVLLQMAKDILEELIKLPEEEVDTERYKSTPHLKRFTAKSVYISSLTILSEKLRTEYPSYAKEWLEFMIEKFNDSHRLYNWYITLSKVYNTLKKNELAASVIIEPLKNKTKFTEFQVENLGERGWIISKKKSNRYLHDTLVELLPSPIDDDFLECEIYQKTVRDNITGRKRDYEVTGDDGSKMYKKVEEIALDYYIGSCGYTDGKHCEGSIIIALFTLFFWDLIYEPEQLVPGTFLSDKQTYPLDLFTPHFYIHRKDLIDSRLLDIAENWSDDRVLEFVKYNWKEYAHITSICQINQVISNLEVLEVLVSCIGRNILMNIFKRLVTNIREYRSGMPDLLVWDINQKKAKFVEVKGENDNLLLKQKLWLRYLKSIGANIQVCYVNSIGSKKKIKKVERVTPKKTASNKKKLTEEKCSSQKCDSSLNSNHPEPSLSQCQFKEIPDKKLSKEINHIASNPIKMNVKRKIIYPEENSNSEKSNFENNSNLIQNEPGLSKDKYPLKSSHPPLVHSSPKLKFRGKKKMCLYDSSESGKSDFENNSNLIQNNPGHSHSNFHISETKDKTPSKRSCEPSFDNSTTKKVKRKMDNCGKESFDLKESNSNCYIKEIKDRTPSKRLFDILIPKKVDSKKDSCSRESYDSGKPAFENNSIIYQTKPGSSNSNFYIYGSPSKRSSQSSFDNSTPKKVERNKNNCSKESYDSSDSDFENNSTLIQNNPGRLSSNFYIRETKDRTPSKRNSQSSFDNSTPKKVESKNDNCSKESYDSGESDFENNSTLIQNNPGHSNSNFYIRETKDRTPSKRSSQSSFDNSTPKKVESKNDNCTKESYASGKSNFENNSIICQNKPRPSNFGEAKLKTPSKKVRTLQQSLGDKSPSKRSSNSTFEDNLTTKIEMSSPTKKQKFSVPKGLTIEQISIQLSKKHFQESDIRQY